jgi:hypothetical protein
LPFSMMLHFGAVSETSFGMESSQINLGLHHLNQGRVVNPVYPVQSRPGVPSVDIQRSYNRIDAFQGHAFNYTGGAIEPLRCDSDHRHHPRQGGSIPCRLDRKGYKYGVSSK